MAKLVTAISAVVLALGLAACTNDAETKKIRKEAADLAIKCIKNPKLAECPDSAASNP